MLRKQNILLFAILLLTTCTRQAEEEALQILCFGDSITQGTFINNEFVKNNSWVNILQKLGGTKIHVINEGRVGRRTSDKEEILKVLKQNRDVDHVILFLGINDLCIAREEILKDCVTNTDWMVKRSREAYKDVIITIMSSAGLSIGNVTERWYKSGYNEKEQAMLKKLRQEYKEYVEINEYNFVDLWGVVSKENYSDGLHPNLKGQQQIAETVWDSLIKCDARLR